MKIYVLVKKEIGKPDSFINVYKNSDYAQYVAEKLNKKKDLTFSEYFVLENELIENCMPTFFIRVKQG